MRTAQVRRAVSTDGAPPAIGPYSQAVVANGLVFCSGTAGIDPATGVAPDGIELDLAARGKVYRAPVTNTEVRLVRRPDGTPALDDFALVDTPRPRPEPGQVLVRNHFLALGAVMRPMLDGGPPGPGFTVGEALFAKAVGEVVASDVPAFPAGAGVLHLSGWRTYTAASVTGLRPADLADPVAHLGGGRTALAGLRTAGLRAGETVYVSGAAGAVGTAAGALARALGAARVIGSTGTARKVAELTGLGFDAAFDHRAEPAGAALRRLAPDGVDVVFDTVGGNLLAALIDAVPPRTRFALCGALAGQLGGEPDPALDLDTVIGKRLSLQGFSAADHAGLDEELRRHRPALPHTVVDGLAAAPRALLDLFAGRHLGAVLVRLGREA
jgi:NADPH-dependent curcumin reductase CurA